ncbi:alpha/beta-hydrolase [Aureobasidium subglaciale]|nr:alpha/beta-hydrolase [Aureobasidium subglaciale]KAI5213073.1 alpha/beta-hydrolase [Aureobasidium subglaciale]KAI5214295.1 alpha/beta-hydrolase [Aureobasidium subglaciale]KAI5252477.1 alpha/beta-hydrolase [Aureobasidium subglaciale]
MSSPGSKFSPFNVFDDIVYKTVDNAAIKAAVLVPKSLKPGVKAPCIVHWHGGGFMTGNRLFEPWFALWFMQWAESMGAVVVSPDHRLLPESSSEDMAEDVIDFWNWVHTNLSTEVSKATSGTVEIDLSEIVVGGESAACSETLAESNAGGFLSVLSALTCPDAGIKAVICQYGPLDYHVPWFMQPNHHRTIMGQPPAEPGKPEAQVQEYLAKHVNVDQVVVRTESRVEELWPLCVAYMYTGGLAEALGQYDQVMPMKLIETVKSMPPTWFIHGNEDSVVNPDCTMNFVNKVRKTLPETPMHISLQPGEHGFDGEVGLDEKWVQEGLSFVLQYWPRES